MRHGEHGWAAGQHEHGAHAVWGGPGLLIALVLVLVLLVGLASARDEVVRARLLAAWGVLRRPPAASALAQRWRSAQRRPRAATPAGTPPAGPPGPRRPDPRLIASFPDELRAVLTRVDELAAGLTVPASTTWPARALAEHRLETVRTTLVELVDTLALIPPDLRLQPDARTGTTPLQEAAATAGLLEEEVVRLRSEVHADLAATLQRQRAFLAGKYQRPRSSSGLDLS